MQILTLTLGNNDFGIPLKNVKHIEAKTSIVAELPTAPKYIKGIAMVRGEVAPIYSLALRLGYTEENIRYLIIVVVGGMKMGIEADRVNRVINIDEKEIYPLSLIYKTKKCFLNGAVLFRKKQIIILMDVNRLMIEEKFDQLLA